MGISNILRGWGNLILDEFDLLSPELKDLAERRLKICDSCEIRTDNKCDKRKKGINIETGQLVKGCSCNLSAKCLDPDSECPLAKWKKYNG